MPLGPGQHIFRRQQEANRKASIARQEAAQKAAGTFVDTQATIEKFGSNPSAPAAPGQPLNAPSLNQAAADFKNSAEFQLLENKRTLKNHPGAQQIGAINAGIRERQNAINFAGLDVTDPNLNKNVETIVNAPLIASGLPKKASGLGPAGLRQASPLLGGNFALSGPEFGFIPVKGGVDKVPSSGGFDKVGENIRGESVVRSSVTGNLSFENPNLAFPSKAGPGAVERALGKQKAPRVLAEAGRGRRQKRSTRGTIFSRTRKSPSRGPSTNILGNQSILGSQSILG